ncbi:Synaptophysin / synaptoporin [Dirofilaria immitis]|nr:Synaptophysin / synaptoporin [Dirofilaria immitis]
MASTRQETYTRTQPTDTAIMTTTKRIAIFYRIENIILVVIIGLLIISSIVSVYGPGPFKGILFGQTFLLIFAGIALCFSFIFLVVFLFELHETHLDFWPWKISDFMFSMTACCSYIILGFIEAYYSTGAWSNNCNDIGSDGIIHNHCRTIYEWVLASLLAFFNGFLYGISAFWLIVINIAD